MSRTKIPGNVMRDVLIEAGYRCAVPTCRNILAIDLHHIVEVKDGGSNEQAIIGFMHRVPRPLYERYNFKSIVVPRNWDHHTYQGLSRLKNK